MSIPRAGGIPDPWLQISVVKEGLGATVVALVGELDMVSTDELVNVLVCAVGSIVIADLAGLRFMDAAGIGALIGAKHEIQSSGNQLVIRGAHGMVRRVFEVLGLSNLLEGVE